MKKQTASEPAVRVAPKKAAASPKRATVLDFGRAGDAGATSHYDDAAYYDQAYRSRRDDVAYYVRLGRLLGGPVLEYGIGTGRIALPLARAGIEVVGVDSSREMLAGLERRLAREPDDIRRRVTRRRGDMREVRLRRRFPLVIAPFNVVQHLYERTDVEAFLARVREHLAPSGRFVFDVLVPHARDLGADPAKRYGAPRFRHPTAGGLVRYGERFDYDAIRQVLLVTMEFEPLDGQRGFAVPLTHRQFFPRELEALLHYNGFGDLVITADFTDGPPELDAQSLVFNCRAVPGRRSRSSRPPGRRTR